MAELNNYGLYYYKLTSQYNEDVKKDCKLSITDIDNNFYNLKNYGISSMTFDENDTTLTLHRNDKSTDNLTVTLNPLINKTIDELVNLINSNSGETENNYFSGLTRDYSINYDGEGTLTVNWSTPYNPSGETFSLSGLVDSNNIFMYEKEGFTDPDVNSALTEIIEEVFRKLRADEVLSDGTLNGNGSKESPLTVAENERTGQVKPVKAVLNDRLELPIKPTIGDRFVVKGKTSKYGMLYNLSGVTAVKSMLSENHSEWRVPTKEDWDKLLNYSEACCDDMNHNNDMSGDYGKNAGYVLKGEEWDEAVKLTPYDEALNSFNILPTIDSKKTSFWTDTVGFNTGETYVKEFSKGKGTVHQTDEDSDSFNSLRLVRDYFGGYNNCKTVKNGTENILGENYKTVIVAGVNDGCEENEVIEKSVWLASNLNVNTNDENCEPVDKNSENYYYYVYSWNGCSWEIKELSEGDTFIVHNHVKNIEDESGNTIDTSNDWIYNGAEYRVATTKRGNQYLRSVENELYKEIEDREAKIMNQIKVLSGVVDTNLASLSGMLENNLLSVIANVSGDVVELSGNLYTKIDGVSYELETVSAKLDTDISVLSASTDEKIGDLSDNLYEKIASFSGDINEKVDNVSSDLEIASGKLKNDITILSGSTDEKINSLSDDLNQKISSFSGEIYTRINGIETKILNQDVVIDGINLKIESVSGSLVNKIDDEVKIINLNIKSLNDLVESAFTEISIANNRIDEVDAKLSNKIDSGISGVMETIKSVSGDLKNELVESVSDLNKTIESVSGKLENNLTTSVSGLNKTIVSVSGDLNSNIDKLSKLVNDRLDIASGDTESNFKNLENSISDLSKKVFETLSATSATIETEIINGDNKVKNETKAEIMSAMTDEIQKLNEAILSLSAETIENDNELYEKITDFVNSANTEIYDYLDELNNLLSSKVMFTQGSLEGDGSYSDPIRLRTTERAGQVLPVKAILRQNDFIANYRDKASLGDRFVVKSTTSKYGFLYSEEGMRRVNEALKGSKWRVPTKKDWDKLLNYIELANGTDCQHINHDESATTATLYGGKAGLYLKHNNDLSEEWASFKPKTYGEDIYGFNALPTSNSSTDEEMVEDVPSGETEFWTSTKAENNGYFTKMLSYNTSGVTQGTSSDASDGSHWSAIRLVRDFNSATECYSGDDDRCDAEFGEPEIILGFEYGTMILNRQAIRTGCDKSEEYSGISQVWTTSNLVYVPTGGKKLVKQADTYQPNSNIDEYYVYYRSCDGWDIRQLQEGETFTVKEHYSDLVDENGDGKSTANDWIQENAEYRVFANSRGGKYLRSIENELIAGPSGSGSTNISLAMPKAGNEKTNLLNLITNTDNKEWSEGLLFDGDLGNF